MTSSASDTGLQGLDLGRLGDGRQVQRLVLSHDTADKVKPAVDGEANHDGPEAHRDRCQVRPSVSTVRSTVTIRSTSRPIASNTPRSSPCRFTESAGRGRGSRRGAGIERRGGRRPRHRARRRPWAGRVWLRACSTSCAPSDAAHRSSSFSRQRQTPAGPQCNGASGLGRPSWRGPSWCYGVSLLATRGGANRHSARGADRQWGRRRGDEGGRGVRTLR
jgi:hypothetical protein